MLTALTPLPSIAAKTAFNATLALAAFGGILSIGVLAPNVLGGIAKLFDLTGREQKRRYRYLWRGFYELRSSQAFEFVQEKDGYHVYRSTELGRKKLKKLVFDELQIQTPSKWSGKWSLVIFDIPKYFHKKRNALRGKLKEMRFYQCQKSVWIHPFPCIEEVEFVKEMLDIKPFVTIFSVDKMTDGRALYNFKNILKKVV